MHLSSFQVQNFMSFRDSGAVALTPGINIVVGPNDVGKSTFLRALSGDLSAGLHLSHQSVPQRGASPSGESTVNLSMSLSRDEINLFLQHGINEIHLPRQLQLPSDDITICAAQALNQLRAAPNVTFAYRLGRDFGVHIPHFSHTVYPPAAAGQAKLFKYHRDPGLNSWKYVKDEPMAHWQSDVGFKLLAYYRPRIHYFRAQRYNIDASDYAEEAELAPDASNLPKVLATLQGYNRARFDRYNELVRRVFPSITQVVTRPKRGANNLTEVAIWKYPIRSERDDLSFTLNQSGTGVGQVLAMLYVLVAFDHSRVLVIDEPHSFLHPSAVASLLEIFNEFKDHQFIISTHSPEVLAQAMPCSVIQLAQAEGQSKARSVDAESLNEMRSVLGALGVRPSLLFGADRLLWVEGATEEQCFPIIIAGVLKLQLRGLRVVSVVNTGDFDSRRAKSVGAVYGKLTAATTVLPPAVAFVFDRESRSQEERDRINEACGGKAQFLERRCFENYLLDVDAVAVALNRLPGGAQVSASSVEAWLQQHWKDREYGYTDAYGENFEAWQRECKAPKLLDGLFAALTGQCENYNKIRDSERITEWLVKNKPTAFSEIERLLRPIAAAPTSSQPAS